MSEDNLSKALSLLGISLNDGRSRILRAIVKAQGTSYQGTTFDEMRAVLLEEMGGKEIARPLIYRYLKSLEADGLIQVNRNISPNRYISDASVLARGIESRRIQLIDELKEDLVEGKETRTSIISLTPSWLARDLIESLLGTTYESGSRSAQGMSDIQDLIGSEVYSRARKGDIIRATLDWDFKSGRNEDKRRQIGIALFTKQVIMRFLLHNPDYVDKDLLKDRLIEYKRIKSIPEFSNYADSRVTFKTTRTYQAVSLNREGVVLVVSDDPYTAVWIPRAANQRLVDEVVDRFDKDFEESDDFLSLESKY